MTSNVQGLHTTCVMFSLVKFDLFFFSCAGRYPGYQIADHTLAYSVGGLKLGR